jgi:hypothetical protein
MKFIFLQNNWFEETLYLLKDYPNWDHNELEKKLAIEITSHIECINLFNVCSLLRHRNINFDRMFSYILQSIPIDPLSDFFYEPTVIIECIVKSEKTNSLNALILFLYEAQYYENYFNILFCYKSIVNNIDHLIHQNREKFIDFNTIVDVCLKNLNKDDRAADILYKLLKLLKNKDLIQKIKDNLLIYDIMT